MKSLVVEDDDLTQMLMRSVLEKYGVCDVVENGVQAVKMFKKAMKSTSLYDLICLDVIMPVMNGYEALQRIRKLENAAGIRGLNATKVIIISAIEDFQTIASFFEEGACEAYLTKPLNVDELLGHLVELELIEKAGVEKKD